MSVMPALGFSFSVSQLNILISMLSARFLLISALFEAVLFVLHAFFFNDYL